MCHPSEARLRRPRMFILFAKQNCLAQRQSPHHDSRITPSSFAAELPKHTGINDHPIGLVDDLPSHPLARRILFIRKMDGSFRLCVNYRGLNNLTIKNRYPLPLIGKLLDRLGRTKCFTQLDLTNAYHRMQIREEALPSWSKCQFRWEKFRFLEYVVSSDVVLTFRYSSDFYRGSIQGFSKIAAPLTSMLRTSSSTDSSTSATQIAVEYDGVDGGGGKLVEKSSKVQKTLKVLRNLQSPSVRRNQPS